MGLRKYVRQVRPIQENYVSPLNKIQKHILYEAEMSPTEFAKYGGKRARVLVKAIDDGTPLETDSGTFPLTWIDDSDKSKFISAIGKDAADYSSALKSGTRFKPILQNKDGKQFTVKQIVKTAMFGGKGASGEPSGADWEDIITHHYNVLVGQPGFDPKATEAVEKKWDDFDEIGIKIATNFKKNLAGTGMIQYGAGKSKSNLSSFWQNPAKGVKGGTDGTPKTDMYTSNYQISLKKAGGSQLASGGQGETLATFYAALQHFSTDKAGTAVINEVMSAIQDNFEKLSTKYSKGDLEKLSRDKKKQGKLSDKDKTALEGFITTEKFHKEFNEVMIPKLNEISDAQTFKEWFVFEAMSGYSKFKEKKAVASVCMEFNADNGDVTKFIEVTPNGKTSGIAGSPVVSGKIKSVASGVKLYAAWKSAGGNPYSTLRVSSFGEDENFDDMTLRGCIRKVIHEDKISQAFLREEVGQLDEFRFISRTFDRIKKMGKNAILWVKNLITKILTAVKKALDKIKRMGKKVFEGIFNFVGLTPTVNSKLPNEIQGFVTVV